jgi:hypothetical protein
VASQPDTLTKGSETANVKSYEDNSGDSVDMDESGGEEYVSDIFDIWSAYTPLTRTIGTQL